MSKTYVFFLKTSYYHLMRYGQRNRFLPVPAPQHYKSIYTCILTIESLCVPQPVLRVSLILLGTERAVKL